jgi:hypothetical protein
MQLLVSDIIDITKKELTLKIDATPYSGDSTKDSVTQGGKGSSSELKHFKETFDFTLELKKDAIKPYITKARESTEGYKTDAPDSWSAIAGADDKFLSKNPEFQIYDDEAISYAIRHNEEHHDDHDGHENLQLPSEIQGKSLEDAVKICKRSRLTKAEKEIYDYMLNMKNNIEKYAYFSVTAAQTLNRHINTAELKCINDASNAISARVSGNEVKALYTYLKNNYFDQNEECPTIPEIRSKPYPAKLFSNIIQDLIKDEADVSAIMWNYKQAKECDISNMSQITDHDGRTKNSLAYAFWDKKINGVDSYLTDKLMGNGAISSQSDLSKVLSMDYHCVECPNPKGDMSGESICRPTGCDLEKIKCQIRPVDADTAMEYICNVVRIKKPNPKDPKCPEYFYGIGQTDNKNYKPGKDNVEEILYKTGEFTIGTEEIGHKDKAGAKQPAFKANTYKGLLGKPADSKLQFYKKVKPDMNDVTDRNLIGKHVFNTDVFNHASGGYNKSQWPKEWTDLSGIMIIPDSSNGRYYDVCIDGKELKETVGDNSYNNSGDTRHINYYTDAIKNSRKTQVLRDSNKKFNILTVGNIQFFRVGHVVKFFIDAEDLDAEKNKQIILPKVEIKERGDKTGKCVSVFDNLCICLQNMESTLSLDLNYSRDDIRSGTNFKEGPKPSGKFDADSSSVNVSRWNEIMIPVEVKGFLEKCECFNLSLEKDMWQGEHTSSSCEVDSSSLGDLSQGEKIDLPMECQDMKYILEYKFNQHGMKTSWLPAEGKEFCYECHNESKPDTSASDMTKGNSEGRNSNSNGYYSKSSNIQGQPSFRLRLPAQNKMVGFFKRMYNTNNIQGRHFSAVERDVNIKLSYSKSAGKQNAVHQKVNIIVCSDAYDPEITFNSFTYDKYSGARTGRGSTRTWKDSSSAANKCDVSKMVYHGTKVVPNGKNGNETEQAYPDYSKLKLSDLDSSDLSNESLTKQWKQGNMRNLCACLPENKSGVEYPVAEISFPNFKVNGEDAAVASISHIFRYEEDEEEFLQSGKFGLPFANHTNNGNDRFVKDTTRSDAADLDRIIPANTNYKLIHTDNNSKCVLVRNEPINYEKWVGKSDDSTIVNGSGFSHKVLDTRRRGWVDKAVPELVTIRVDYRVPADTAGTSTLENFTNVIETKYINVLVEPKDSKEIHYQETFNFKVNECEGKVDIASILSANLHGSDKGICYFLQGVVDCSGKLWMLSDASDYDFKRNEQIQELFNDVSTGKNNTTTLLKKKVLANDRLYLGLNATGKVNESTDIISKHDMNLKECLVDGKLCLYHRNFGNPSTDGKNNLFDTWERKYYGFVVEARYENQDQSCVESTYSLVNIWVDPVKTGFSLDKPEVFCIEHVETQGTEAENKTKDQNNPANNLQLKNLLK